MRKVILLSLVWILSGGGLIAQVDEETLLFGFEESDELQLVEGIEGADFELVPGPAGHWLRVHTSHLEEGPGVVLEASEGTWNLDQHIAVEMEVFNPATQAVWVYGSVETERESGCGENLGSVLVPPRESRTLHILFRRIPPAEDSPLSRHFKGMRGLPGGYVEHWCVVDPSRIHRVSVYLPEPHGNQVIEIDNIRAVGVYNPPTEEELANEFFPFIDEFGQYRYKKWPGKVYSIEGLRKNRLDEAMDLSSFPGPASWNRYGGWRTGPKLKATGHFRTEKLHGKWWLVDPEGRLFWSHGLNCVRTSNAATPLLDREHYFESLPENDHVLAQFYGEQKSAPRGYYQGKQTRTFNFTGANLHRKHGEQWRSESAIISHQRLRSWGLNTIANWSEEYIYLQKKTPYVVNVGFQSSSIEGSEGTWQKFPDVFDESFRANLRSRMSEERDKSANDPWCLGYFVNAELRWGSEEYLSLASLQSPAEQPAKQAFVKDLREKYAEVDRLNEVWGTDHSSWDALLQSRESPDVTRAGDDLREFHTRLAETYFSVIRDELKRAAPEKLYLGCRFSNHNPRAIRASVLYCDVVSFNVYRRSPSHLPLPEDVDKPVLIGEFHFGALDRGLFHTGLRSTANQMERAEAYKYYVQTALDHPNVVGTHWFQYGDQAATGRFDGENYQIGFVDICDSPYRETVAASREIGYQLYRFRMNGGE